MRKRSVGINVRVSVTEKRKMTLMAKRCGLSLSEYLRQRALGYEPGGHPWQMKFSHDGNDADDANDAEIDITQLFKWDISQTASSASLASQRSRKESKHGQSVATGQPAEKPTGTAPNPCEAASA